MTEVTPDPRPEQRIVADAEAWAEILAAKYGPCRVTGDEYPVGSGMIDMAHLVSRAQRGDDTADNLVPIRHDLHMIWHDRSPGWEDVAHAVRHSLTPAETAYVVSKKGRWWFNKNLPKGDVALCASCKKRLETAEEREARKLEPPRPRKRWVITVPADAEDGADVLDTLVEECRKRIGREEGCPPYFVVSEVLYAFLTSGPEPVEETLPI